VPAASAPLATDDALAALPPATRAWLQATHGAPSEIQARAWTTLARGAHALLVAPTGSGKTLAAFLASLGRLIEAPTPDAPQAAGTRVLYISPIKALAHDIERNLAQPLGGIVAAAGRLGLPARTPRVDVRTGDTDARTRRQQRRDPAEVLVTTPESLYLLLASDARARLATVETIIIDEVHALLATKRGVHLQLSLERVAALCTAAGRAEPQRVGLSATVRPLAAAAAFLGGDRPVEIVDAQRPPALDVRLRMAPPPAPAPTATTEGPSTSELADGERGGAWATLLPALLADVLANRQTIIFVNSRRLAERLAAQLTEQARARGACGPDEELVRAHHGSVSRATRIEIEADLKAGRLRAIAATGSMELGVDMSAVDLVVQLESPGSVARGLQRIGRAGHQVGAVSRGQIVARFRGDLLEATACLDAMTRGAVEAQAMPRLCLDVLAQQVVAHVAAAEPARVAVDDLAALVRRAASYRDLTDGALRSVLDMLAGRYPSDKLAELRPRLSWDRVADRLTARPGARLLAVANAGTIPDRGLYPVHLGPGGPRIGELDEEMVHESRRGDAFVLGASTWRIDDITRDRVIVTPAPGEPGKMPFWRGDGLGRDRELGLAVGRLTGELDLALRGASVDEVAAALAARTPIEPAAARDLVEHVAQQRQAHGAVPTDRVIVIERFRDQLGDWRVCILSPLGQRVHTPWGLLIARRLEAALGYPAQLVTADDGISLRVADGDEQLDPALLLPSPDELDELLHAELGRSARFAALFRENAARALLLPRRRPGVRTPLWAQRQRAAALLSVAREHAEFPIVLETMRECLQDAFDLEGLRALLTDVASGAVRTVAVTSEAPSPFAASLVFAFVATFLYDGDAPVAERQAQALAVDQRLLGELLGGAPRPVALPPGPETARARAEVVAEVSALADGYQARSGDELHDLLRRLGDLAPGELAARVAPGLDVAAALGGLAAQGRAREVALAGTTRWIACDDEARYRALADAPTPALVAALLPRHVGGAGPQTAPALAARWGLGRALVDDALAQALAAGELVTQDGEWWTPELVRRVRHRVRSQLRASLAPVPTATLATCVLRWHGVGAGRLGLAALRGALERLEGVPLSFAELEASYLPARVADYTPRMLDELGALGEVVWLGAGALGAKDGRIVLASRAAAALLAPVEASTSRGAIHALLLEHLGRHGASFLIALEQAVVAAGLAPRPSIGAAAAPAARAPTPRALVEAALWDLMWDGLVTNDTFAPCARAASPPAAAPRRSPPSPGAGR
jgi:ATP-dependent Lhr-like helicase